METWLEMYPEALNGFNAFFPETQVAKGREKDTLDGLRWLLGAEMEEELCLDRRVLHQVVALW